MTKLNWKALQPHVPLGPGAPEYIAREGSAGAEIVRWIGAGRSPLLVGGPAGVGKSTELARAAKLLQPTRVACLVQLDRFENMRRLTPDRMLMRIAQTIGHVATQEGALLPQGGLLLPLSPSLRDALTKVDRELRGDLATQPMVSPLSLVNAAAKELQRASMQDSVTLLIDGLEKAPEGDATHDLFDALAQIHESVELVVVIPWHAAFGPRADTVIRAGERFIGARALDVERSEDQAFLQELLERRLQLAPAERMNAPFGLLDEAIYWSGGLPRVFLQLMADAGSYRGIRGFEGWPTEADLKDAIQDQVDSFRRLILPGDFAAVQAASGSMGAELELDRKVRLMAHGVLLERPGGVLRVHPIAQLALELLYA